MLRLWAEPERPLTEPRLFGRRSAEAALSAPFDWVEFPNCTVEVLKSTETVAGHAPVYDFTIISTAIALLCFTGIGHTC